MELFKDDDTKNKNGYMQVTTEHPFYEPGQTVKGTIYLRVKKDIKTAKHIELEVKGGSKNSFKRFWMENHGDEENPQWEEHSEKLKRAHKFMHYKEKVWDAPEVIEAGDYTIGFEFVLPGKIPSSLMFTHKNKKTEPKAKVKYFVKAKLNCSKDAHDMKHKKVLMIREEAVDLQEKTTLKETSEIKTWMCCSQGNSTLEAEFNKNVFTPRETAEGDLKINNEECKTGVKEVTFAIIQETRIN